MLIIVEGLDRTGKSTLVNALQTYYQRHADYNGSVIIRKQYEPLLYPINFTKASEYDWQTILDRVVLANPDTMFIADRSFFTQTVYQTSFGIDEHALTEHDTEVFTKYIQTVLKIPHLVVYCESGNYELDQYITSIAVHRTVNKLFKKILTESGLQCLLIKTDTKSILSTIQNIKQIVQEDSYRIWAAMFANKN